MWSKEWEDVERRPVWFPRRQVHLVPDYKIYPAVSLFPNIVSFAEYYD